MPRPRSSLGQRRARAGRVVRDEAQPVALAAQLGDRLRRAGDRLPGDVQHAVDVEQNGRHRLRVYWRVALRASTGPAKTTRRGRLSRHPLGDLPVEEIELRFSRSSGPGGQHAQRTETRVEAILDVEASQRAHRGSETARDRPCRADPARRGAGRAQPVAEPRARHRAPRRDASRSPRKSSGKRRPTKPTAASRRAAAGTEETALGDQASAPTALVKVV